ncbi:hypothetical protein [Streptomyces sp. ODS05-4]|uniref:hypothetical protein n=1 Tax=Streptomyces sp. ODS05-4 TaxID=2944939 RepID=UPI00210E2F4D|nr:hypothetical protein [Streptomyces sp. ODS05-4]
MTATTGAPAPYTRRISRIERGYLNAHAAGVPQLIQVVVEGEGALDPGALRDAVRAATRANPGLAVRRRAAAWHAGGPPPPVTVLPPDTALDSPFLRRDLDPVTGPVCEVGVTTAGPARLVVRASHLVTDGRGLRNWLGDVFRVLRGERPEGAPSTVDDSHFRAAAGPLPERPPPARAAGLPAVLPTGPATTAPRWTRRRVPARPPAVTARVAAGLSRHLPTGTGRLGVPVDLRRHDRSVRSTANLTSPLLLDIGRDEDWRALHGRILRGLLAKDDVAALAHDFRRHNPYATTLAEALRADTGRYPVTALVTDHGRIDPAELSAPGFRATGFATLPMIVPHAEMFLSACQVGDTTELTLSCRDHPGAAAASETLLDSVAHALTAP